MLTFFLLLAILHPASCDLGFTERRDTGKSNGTVTVGFVGYSSTISASSTASGLALDAAYTDLVRQTEANMGTDYGPHDHVLLAVSNPFTLSSQYVDFIVDGGATHTTVTQEVFNQLGLKAGGVCVTEYGDGLSEVHQKTVITLGSVSNGTPFPLNVTACVSKKFNLFSKHLMDLMDFCHCPRNGLKIWPNVTSCPPCLPCPSCSQEPILGSVYVNP